MDYELTDRQIKLLEAIIKEYSESSEPVGSKTVVKKYALKVSPATIRNEMAGLIEDGFLAMVHTSSGRIPTSRGFRFFIEKIMEEDEFPVLHEVAFKQRLWPHRHEFEKMLRSAVLSLAEATNQLAIAITNEGFVTYAGMVNLLIDPEFESVHTAKTTMELLDRHEILIRVFEDLYKTDGVNIAVGEEINLPNMDNTAMVFAPFNAGRKSGYVAVFGPARMKYPAVVPAVRYTKNLIEELAGAK